MNAPEVRTLPLSSLSPAAWRARAMTQTMLPFFRRSLDRFGSVRLPVWNERTGELVDGCELVAAMIDDGWTEAECVVVDLSGPEAKAFHIELNGPHRGEWDVARLGELVEDIREGAPEILDDLGIVYLELWADRRIHELTPEAGRPGQASLFEEGDVLKR